MELGEVRSGRKLDTDKRDCGGVSVILRKSLLNFCRSHADHSVTRGVVIDGPTKHLDPDCALTQGIRLAGQGVFYQQPKKVLAPLASGECITRNHQLQRSANRIKPFSGALIRFFELMPY